MPRDAKKFQSSVEDFIRSESFALKVLNTSLNGLYVYDFKLGKNIFINAQYTRLTGYTLNDLQAMGDTQFFSLFHPEDQQRVSDHIERIVLNTTDLPEIEYRFKTKDGRWIWCLSRDSVFARSKGGSVSQFVGAFFDMTSQKLAEEALQESLQEFTEFNYALVHNIKAPFRAVKNYAKFLVEDLAESLQGGTKRLLEGIQIAVEEANRQFDDLESLYRIRSHTVEYEFIDVREVLNEIAALHQVTPDRQLVIAERWPIIRGERFLLHQILSELTNNGFKYNRSDIKRVEISWRYGVDHRFEVIVRDNGIGIDPRYHEQIFRIFQRLHTEQEYNGTGIGLAVVMKAVKRLGGEVRIEHADGKGSTFVIGLPATMIEAASGQISDPDTPI